MNKAEPTYGMTVARMGIRRFSLQRAQIKGHSVNICAGSARFAVNFFHLQCHLFQVSGYRKVRLLRLKKRENKLPHFSSQQIF